MDPFDILWEFVTSKFQNTEYWPSIVASAIILGGTVYLRSKPKRLRNRVGIVAIAVGTVISAWNFLMKWNYNFLYFLAGVFVLYPILWFSIEFLWNRHYLRKAWKMCEQDHYIEALELLDDIAPKSLTSKQLRSYQKRRFFVLVKLGSLRKARSFLEEICPEKGAFYHFSLHMLSFLSGDMETSFREIQAAEDSEDLKRDSFLQVQIMLNHGVCYATNKNYHLADEYYRKAITFYEDHKLQDKGILVTLYYNFAFNLQRLSPDTEDWKAALDQCQSKLNMKKIEAQVDMLNLRLELLRQTEAPKEVIDDLLREAASKITNRKLPLKKQVIFASSAARIAWSAKINPIPWLKILSDNLSVIEALPVDQRYYIYAGLDILFRELHGPVNDHFAELKAKVADYLETRAENDLRQWQGELPEEAIYARCACFKEMAVQSQKRTPYRKDSVVNLRQNAIRLYHDNELYLDELSAYQDIIDELLDIRNRDEDFRPMYADEIREHLSKAEDLLSQLAGHPALVEIYLRLGSYCLDLDEYEKSLNYARLFWDTGISIHNFAPWVRRYYALLLLHVRVILFDKAIKMASADNRLRSYSSDVQEWFTTYPQHDGNLETLLLGRFLSIPVRKIKFWMPDGGSEPLEHTWLWIPDFGLNIDLTYPQFTDDQHCKCIFFHGDRHPFEAETSLALQLRQQHSPLRFSVTCLIMGHERPEITALVDRIYDLVCSYIPQDCPTTEEFLQLMQEFIAPVPIRS